MWILALLLLPLPILAGLAVRARARREARMIAVAADRSQPPPGLPRAASFFAGPEAFFGPPLTRPLVTAVEPSSGMASEALDAFGSLVERTSVMCNVRGVPCERAAQCRRFGCRSLQGA